MILAVVFGAFVGFAVVGLIWLILVTICGFW
ncbi:hypothetical protein ABIA94_009171 [Bradyrhizobium sp. LA7.1]